MNRRALLLAAVLSLAACEGARQAPAPAATELAGELVVINLTPQAQVASPLVVEGRAVGAWYFEAIFHAELRAEDGTLLAEAPAQAQESWMQEGFVPFRAELSFDPQGHERGAVVLRNANMGENPENARSLTIPVRF
jgi:uncharacterized lipoprotein YbaY